MGSRYLTDLADVCRGAGLAVIEVDGWQSRARGSGGYNPGCPDHVMVHHTASPPSADGWPDVDYCTFGDDDAPLCNLYLSRDGTVYVCAAGATNTNGSGTDMCRIVPDDSMNTHAIGIEAGNDGRGEEWPAAQLDAYNRVCAVLCHGYSIDITQIHSHWQWAPTRKTDPAGGPRYSAPPAPPAGPTALSWNMGAFCDDVRAAPTPEVPDMTEAQARQLAELHQSLVAVGGNPGQVDPAGNPTNTPWLLWYVYLAVLALDERVKRLGG